MIATAALTAVSVGASIYGGIEKNKQGRKMQQQAQKEMDKFKWDELENAFKDTQVSTSGADLQREESARTASGIVDALRTGGSRNILGGIDNVQSGINKVNQNIAVDLDQQDKAIQMAKAQDEQRIRDMKANRQSRELQGYGALYSAGMDMKYSGMGDISSGVGAAGQAAGAMGNIFKSGNGQQTGGSNFSQFDFTAPQIVQNPTAPDFNKIYGGSIFNTIGNNFSM